MNYGTQQIADEWLVLQSQDGDAGAFEQLVSRWQERLWRHARRLIRDDDAGKSLASGIYFYELNAVNKTLVKKMSLIK